MKKSTFSDTLKIVGVVGTVRRRGRTYSALSTRFTVWPNSPTLAHSHIWRTWRDSIAAANRPAIEGFADLRLTSLATFSFAEAEGLAPNRRPGPEAFTPDLDQPDYLHFAESKGIESHRRPGFTP